MTEIAPTTPVATPAAAPATTSQAASEGADQLISSDFETFLRMLTAQLENQDPLDPLESTDFAVQLATFSSVEQQVLTNDRLSELNAQLTASSLSSLSGWIGNQVLSDLPVYYAGQQVDLVTTTEPGAAQAKLAVHDENDILVDLVSIDPQGGPVSWFGPSDGSRLADGTYRFSTVSYTESGEQLGDDSREAQAYQEVTEVFANNGSPLLALPGGGRLPAESILAVRQSPAPIPQAAN